MRILAIVAHYFDASGKSEAMSLLGSSRAPLAKIAALNSEIVALHRHFGPHRLQRNPKGLIRYDTPSDSSIDIVIVTARDKNLLDKIDIDPAIYSVEYPPVEPIMLGFEAQRIMRERAGQYDMYVYLEDDLTITDPAFFEKIQWFAASVEPRAILLPVRYEMSHSGTPAKVAIEFGLSRDKLGFLDRPGRPSKVEGIWNGRAQTFRRPTNPHAACFAITAAQLDLWMKQPSFYDRDVSWIDPLVSAATYAPGKVFDLYMPAEPNPWFIEIEHYGARYAAAVAPPGMSFGEPPLLKIAETLVANQGRDGSADIDPVRSSQESINTMFAHLTDTRHDFESLKHSRSRLAKALLQAIFRKAVKPVRRQ